MSVLMRGLSWTGAGILAASVGVMAQGPRGQGPGQFSMMRLSPILAAVDADGNGTVSPAELTNAPARLRTLDKNGDGRLTRDEAGITFGGGRGRGPGRGGEEEEPPAAGPTADELLATLLSYDKNGDGKLQKSEVPERLQGMFDSGDTNKDGVLDGAELKKLAADQAAATPGEAPGGRGPGRGGDRGGERGGDGGRGGFGPMDAAFNALDANHDGEISKDEIANASAALRTLDANHDGSITEDEVRPAMGPGRGFGGGGR